MTMVLTIAHDPHPENPCDWDGWKVHSFCSRHASFTELEKLGVNPETRDGYPVVRNPGLRRKLDCGLAFWLTYYEHGDCSWSRVNTRYYPDMQWDGARIGGLLIWGNKSGDLGAKTLPERQADADHFLEVYTHWCNGWCYIAHLDESEDGDNLETIQAYGIDDLEQAVVEMIRSHRPTELLVEGDCADMIRTWDLPPWTLRTTSRYARTPFLGVALVVEDEAVVETLEVVTPPLLPEPRRDIVRKTRK